jgi:hypothetical protein
MYQISPLTNEIFNVIFPIILSSFDFSIYLSYTINERQFYKLTRNLSFLSNINYIS